MKRNDHTGGPCPIGRRATGMTRTLTAALCLVVCVCGPAQAAERDDTAEEVSLGVASTIVTIPYGAAKILYAGLGGVIGGFAWALSGGDMDAAESVWDASLHGTYVITPDHLRGKKPIRFSGVSPYQDDE